MDKQLEAVVWCAVSDPKQAAVGMESLPNQEAEGLAAAARLGLHVKAVLKVPGFSRNYISIEKCAAAMLKEQPPITAMRELIDLMESDGFDVLICRGADRFGRTQSLVTTIAETIYTEMHGKIYVTGLGGMWVERGAFRQWAAGAGVQAATELDNFRERRAIGMEGRFKRGLPFSAPPLSHKYIRDERGKAQALIVDPAKERLLADLAELLINQRLPYDELSRAMYEQYGHVQKQIRRKKQAAIKPYGSSAFQKLLYNPWFWGHKMTGFSKTGKRSAPQGKAARWAYDVSEPLPEYMIKAKVELVRNTHPAGYTGELAQKVMVELTRRENLKGTASPNSAYAYTGLLKCGLCGFALTGHTKHYIQRVGANKGVDRVKVGYRCASKRRAKHSPLGLINEELSCSLPGQIPEAMLHQAVREFLELISTDSSFLLSGETRSRTDRIDQLASEIAQLEAQLNDMIKEQAGRKGTARMLYTTQIDQMGEQLDRLKAAEQREQAAQAGEAALSSRKWLALDALRALTVDGMMARALTDKAGFNQLLSALISHISVSSIDPAGIRIQV